MGWAVTTWQHRNPGDRYQLPRAEEQNSWNRAAEFHETERSLGEKIKAFEKPRHTELDKIELVNNSGDDLVAGAILQIDGSPLGKNEQGERAQDATKPDRTHPWFDGIKPDGACNRYGALVRHLKSEEIGEAQVSGPTFARVDISNGHTRCSVRKDTTHLIGDDDGPIEILWKPDGTTSGIHLCLVEFEQVGPPTTYVAKVLGGIPSRQGLQLGKATAEIYRLDPHDYTTCEDKALVPVTIPSGSTLTKCVFNLSESAISDEYVLVHRDECGNWLAGEAGSMGLICFRSEAHRTRETDAAGNFFGRKLGRVMDVVGSVPNQVGDLVELRDCERLYLGEVAGCYGIAVPTGGKNDSNQDIYVVIESQELAAWIAFRTKESRSTGAPEQVIKCELIDHFGFANAVFPPGEATQSGGGTSCSDLTYFWRVDPQHQNGGYWEADPNHEQTPCCTWPGQPSGVGQFDGDQQTVPGVPLPLPGCQDPPGTTNIEVEVKFLEGTFPQALGPDETESGKGAMGFAFLDVQWDETEEDNAGPLEYIAVQCDQRTTRISFIGDKICAGEHPDIDDGDAMDFFPHGQLPKLPLTATNEHNHASMGGPMEAEWDEAKQQYILDDVPLVDEIVLLPPAAGGCELRQRRVSLESCEEPTVSKSVQFTDVLIDTRTVIDPSDCSGEGNAPSLKTYGTKAKALTCMPCESDFPPGAVDACTNPQCAEGQSMYYDADGNTQCYDTGTQPAGWTVCPDDPSQSTCTEELLSEHEFPSVSVIVDVFDDECLKQRPQQIYIVCAGSLGAEEDVAECTDCESGSGSGG